MAWQFAFEINWTLKAWILNSNYFEIKFNILEIKESDLHIITRIKAVSSFWKNKGNFLCKNNVFGRAVIWHSDTELNRIMRKKKSYLESLKGIKLVIWAISLKVPPCISHWSDSESEFRICCSVIWSVVYEEILARTGYSKKTSTKSVKWH